MAAVYPINVDFRRGEITPLLHGAVEADTYRQSAAKITNFLVSRYGGLIRRAGTYYENDSKHGAFVADGSIPTNPTFRLIRFRFSETQAYALEVGHQYIRFHTEDGRVESGGSPVEVSTPYDEDDIWSIDFSQAGDVVYLVCEGYAPRTLTRVSETSWTLATYTTKDGPYLPVAADKASLSPSASGAATPDMTSDTAPTGTASGVGIASGGGSAWHAFNLNPTSWVTVQVTGGTTDSINYTFDNGAPSSTVAVTAYSLRSTPSDGKYGPAQWKFEGYDGTNWVTLDSRRDEEGWLAGETRFFSFENETAYEAYRITIEGSNDTTSAYASIAELSMLEHPDDAAGITLTASSTTGINGGTGFLDADVGRAIRLKGSDGYWRWGKITARSSSTVVTVVLQDFPLPNTDDIGEWKLGAWSSTEGYPSAIGFYEDRQVFNGVPTRPLTIDLSRNSDYDHFGVSDPLVADDGVQLTLAGGELNTARWFVETSELVVGSEGGIRIIGPNDAANAFGATNVRQEGQTAVRASAVKPILIERTVLFVEKHLQAIYETAFTYEASGYMAFELTWLAEHLFRGKIRQLDYQAVPTNTLWVVTDDGKVAACTYDRQNKVFGVTEITFASTTVETLCILPGADGDRVLLGMKYADGSSTGRYIGKMEFPWRSGDSFDPLYLELAVVYSGASTTTISGLDHLEGATVGVYADGEDIGDATVSSGSITLPGGVSATDVCAGLRMTSYVETLRAPSVGQQDGGHLGRRARSVGVYVDLYESYGLKVGTLEETRTITTESDHVNAPSPPSMLTGSIYIESEDSWVNDGVVVMETDRAYPVTIRGLMSMLEGEP